MGSIRNRLRLRCKVFHCCAFEVSNRGVRGAYTALERTYCHCGGCSGCFLTLRCILRLGKSRKSARCTVLRSEGVHRRTIHLRISHKIFLSCVARKGSCIFTQGARGTVRRCLGTLRVRKAAFKSGLVMRKCLTDSCCLGSGCGRTLKRLGTRQRLVSKMVGGGPSVLKICESALLAVRLVCYGVCLNVISTSPL